MALTTEEEHRVRLSFRNEKGELIEGVSEPVPHHMSIHLRVEARGPCPKHGPGPTRTNWSACDCPERPLLGVRDGPANLLTGQWAKACQIQVLNGFATLTLSNTAGSNVALSPPVTFTQPTIVAGTSITSASVGDTNLGAQSAASAGSQSMTVNAYSGTGATGSFTGTGTITNGSGATISYAEVGIEIQSGANTFLMAHDVFASLAVSNGGTLAVTYTLTNS